MSLPTVRQAPNPNKYPNLSLVAQASGLRLMTGGPPVPPNNPNRSVFDSWIHNSENLSPTPITKTDVMLNQVQDDICLRHFKHLCLEFGHWVIGD
jgi:hypothetical protein